MRANVDALRPALTLDVCSRVRCVTTGSLEWCRLPLEAGRLAPRCTSSRRLAVLTIFRLCRWWTRRRWALARISSRSRR
eukprot:349319-Prymnesium_polylepis.1